VAQIDLGSFNIVVALGIAVFKMMLVIWFFMHVRTDNPLTKLFVFAGFFWMAISAGVHAGRLFLAHLDARRQVLVAVETRRTNRTR
jgi:caa(3)-type oxidase subunit IV